VSASDPAGEVANPPEPPITAADMPNAIGVSLTALVLLGVLYVTMIALMAAG
jgi:hypothetical protein